MHADCFLRSDQLCLLRIMRTPKKSLPTVQWFESPEACRRFIFPADNGWRATWSWMVLKPTVARVPGTENDSEYNTFCLDRHQTSVSSQRLWSSHKQDVSRNKLNEIFPIPPFSGLAPSCCEVLEV